MMRTLLAIAAAILPLGMGGCVTGPARADRDWYPYLAHTAHVDLQDAGFAVSPVSDWSYNRAGPTAEIYRDAAYDISALREVWFVLEPQPGSRIAAHTLLLFEFEGDRLLGLTIEARRERDEEYSAVRGIFNAYELSYVWASARDLLTRRAVMLGHEVFVYPIAIPDEQKRALLRNLLVRTDALEQHPRYYNTLFSNCTNELAKAAGFHWAPAYILTGQSDEYLFRRGIIPGDDFAQAHARSDMTQAIAELNSVSADDFDALLLTELRRRGGG